MAKKSDEKKEAVEVVTRNRKAFHEFEIIDRVEAGIVLVGTEVKSLRTGQANLEGAFARVDDGELWLFNAEIPEYAMGTHANHKPKRPRKLLMHRREIGKFAGKASERGFTLIPLQIYFKRGKAKVELAVGRGKQLHDKRQAKKKQEATREIQRAVRNRGKE